MIEEIREYLRLQGELVAKLSEKEVDLWECDETEMDGWECHSHGEHVCCQNVECGQVELPLLTESCVGIDCGHFIYWLKTIGGVAPAYAEMHTMLERLEASGVLKQVQRKALPKVWALTENNNEAVHPASG